MSRSLLTLALDVSSYTFAIVCIFEGVRRISTSGLSKNAVLSAAFGFLYFIGHAGMGYLAHNVQLETSALVRNGQTIPVLAPDWGANYSPQQKNKISLKLAQMDFSQHGQLRYYFDETGKKILFAPRQCDIDNREQMVAQLAQLDYVGGAITENSAQWLLMAVAAALFGFVWSRTESQLTLRSRGTR